MVAALVLVIAGGGFLAGSRYYERAMVERRKEAEALAAASEALKTLEQEKVNLELADTVNRVTLEQLRNQVVDLQQTVSTQREELALFRSLTRDSVDMSELSVDSLDLRRTEEAHTFDYRIVVRGNGSQGDVIDASVTLAIEGMLDGEPYSVPFNEADLSLKGEGVAVRFKYFKVLRGSFVLPEGFEPEKVVLSVIEKGDASSLRISEFPWVVTG